MCVCVYIYITPPGIMVGVCVSVCVYTYTYVHILDLFKGIGSHDYEDWQVQNLQDGSIG